MPTAADSPRKGQPTSADALMSIHGCSDVSLQMVHGKHLPCCWPVLYKYYIIIQLHSGFHLGFSPRGANTLIVKWRGGGGARRRVILQVFVMYRVFISESTKPWVRVLEHLHSYSHSTRAVFACKTREKFWPCPFWILTAPIFASRLQCYTARE